MVRVHKSPEQMEKVIVDDDPQSELPVIKSFNGYYYIWKSSKATVKKAKTPSFNGRKFQYLAAKLPADLVAKHGMFNRLEAYTLKRVSTFTRARHIPRSR